MKHIINVASKLPVSVKPAVPVSSGENDDFHIALKPTALSSAIESIEQEHDVWWIGGVHQMPENFEKQEDINRFLNQNYKQIPVFLNSRQIKDYYHGFSESSLWPLLHYISIYTNYDEGWFKAYKEINQLFANKIIQHARSGDLVWVHNYHLMLVPEMIKEKRPDLQVGFFFHTPFPSFELFRNHPRREELLKGVLGANLIGFQTFGNLRHFRSAALRVLDIESEMNSIVYHGFETKTGVYPVGINHKNIKSVKQTEEYNTTLKKYREEFAGKKIVLSVQKLNHSQGILKQLQSIETFLKYHPEKAGNTVFVVLTIPSREETYEYEHLTHDVEHSVGHINGLYSTVGHSPVHFIKQSVPFTELCALYQLADVMLLTPIRDGMNVMAKEYISAKESYDGVLILSEFTGASHELFNALMVNPQNTNEVVEAINQALNMTDEEKESMLEPMRKRIKSNDAVFWANSFINDLEKTSLESFDSTAVKRLDKTVSSQFKDRSLKKALFLDYDGTLREFEKVPEKAVPGEDLIEILNAFSKRDDLSVHIISGRSQKFLEKHFGKYPFTLVGEHGYFIKKPGQEWTPSLGDFDMSWKEKIKEIFELFTLSTPGSDIEEKNAALVWHYRRSDPEFGSWKANELIGDLTEVISNMPVEIHHGRKIVEVASQYVNKGIAATTLINDIAYDLVLFAGDDKTDETMLKFDKDEIITVKIGEADTSAKYRIATPAHFRKFLKSLT